MVVVGLILGCIDDNVYSNELSSGIYATYNPYGWYSYKIVVKQLEQDYYNIYTPGATVVDNNSYITLFGDNIKFLDYFSSVNIPEYKPFPFVFEDEFSLEKNINNLVNNEDINLPNLDLKLVQDKLLDCAPFKIKNIYR